MDFYSHLNPIYDIDPMERIMDSYLDQYLCYEGNKWNLFPNWLLPNDKMPAPVFVNKFC